MTDQETITKAAIKRGNGEILTSDRHYKIIWKLAKRGIRTGELEKQGFLTNSGRFVEREEAAGIAFAAGQISALRPRLFSEDVLEDEERVTAPNFVEYLRKDAA